MSRSPVNRHPGSAALGVLLAVSVLAACAPGEPGPEAVQAEAQAFLDDYTATYLGREHTLPAAPAF